MELFEILRTYEKGVNRVQVRFKGLILWIRVLIPKRLDKVRSETHLRVKVACVSGCVEVR